jgi:Tfp pilus assembly protein PilN
MHVRLNLATTPLVSHRRFLAGATLVGILGAFLFLFLGWRFYSLRRADAALLARTGKIDQEMSRLRAKRQELDRFFAQQEGAHLQERAKFITAVIEARSFNWTEMFMDLERILPEGVHVLRIEPRLEKGSVSVKFVVGAKGQEAKDKLLKAFEESSSFSEVVLLSEQFPKQPGVDPLTIEFSAVYSGT